MIAEKLEVTIKINELPKYQAVENSWQQFDFDYDGRIISVTVKSKIWNKLGQKTKNEFVLEEPNIQVFERKPKTEIISTVGAA